METIIAETIAQMAQRSTGIEIEMARLRNELERTNQQAAWMAGWTYSPSLEQFRHVDRHTLDTSIVQLDGGAWPFLEMWHKLQRAAASPESGE